MRGASGELESADPPVRVADVGPLGLCSELPMGQILVAQHQNKGPHIYEVSCAFMVPQDTFEVLQALLMVHKAAVQV